MANVNIKFNGKDFLLSCEDGQEEHLEELSMHLNKKFDELKSSLGGIGENKLLLITSIKVMDEYFETRKKINEKKEELKMLSNKFRELKSLVYEYKEKKEIEIKKLNEEQDKFKFEIVYWDPNLFIPRNGVTYDERFYIREYWDSREIIEILDYSDIYVTYENFQVDGINKKEVGNYILYYK